LHPDLFARFVLPESEWTDLRSAEPSSTLAARLLLQFLIAAGFSGVAAAAARFGRGLLDDASGHLEEFGVPCWLSLRSVSNASWAVSPLRLRRMPMAWSMIGRDCNAACNWVVSRWLWARICALSTEIAAGTANISPTSSAWASKASWAWA